MLFTLCGQAQQKASKQNQKKSSLLLKKGLEKAEEGNIDAAVSFFNQSIELNPLNESSLLSLADLMYQMEFVGTMFEHRLVSSAGAARNHERKYKSNSSADL